MLDALADKILASPDHSFVLRVMEADAKMIDVQWRVRVAAGIMSVNAVNASGEVMSGDSFAEIMQRFCRRNLSVEQVQELIRYAFVWPSLTTHPTNPTSVAFTKVGLRLSRLLGETKTTKTQLLAALSIHSRHQHDVGSHARRNENIEENAVLGS